MNLTCSTPFAALRFRSIVTGNLRNHRAACSTFSFQRRRLQYRYRLPVMRLGMGAKSRSAARVCASEPGDNKRLNRFAGEVAGSWGGREPRSAAVAAGAVAGKRVRVRSLSTHNQTGVVGRVGGSQLHGRIRGLPVSRYGWKRKTVPRSISPSPGKPATIRN